MARKNRATSFDDLPEETAANVFLRLPVKSLIRSTSVNKTWYSLITNPNFISSQIEHSVSQCNDDNAVLIVPPLLFQEKHSSLISVETSKLIEKFEVPFNTKTYSLKLISSLKGLLLLTDLHPSYTCRHLYLWNPRLKTHKFLVSTCFKNNLYKHYCVVGLGFSRVSNDFRVVRIVFIRKNQFQDDVVPKVEIYSLKNQTWRKIKDPVVPRLASAEGVYVGSSFYWLENTRPESDEQGRNYNSKDLWILSFDFDNEVFGELKVPQNVSRCIGTSANYRLMVFEGSLTLCVFDALYTNGVINFPYHIWLMRQENGVISWTSHFKATLKEGGWPLNITKTGTILMEKHFSLDPSLSIVSCNLKTMHYKDLGFGIRRDVIDPMLISSCSVDTSFTESLVMYEG